MEQTDSSSAADGSKNRYAAMVAHLEVNDATSILLKGHLWIEELLLDLIKAPLDAPEYIDNMGLSFFNKIQLAQAMNCLSWPEPILELNVIRNKIAHHVRFTVDLSTIRRLVSSFPSNFGTIDEPGDMATRPRIPDDSTPADAARVAVSAIIFYLFAALRHEHELRSRILQSQTMRLERLVSEP